LKRIASVLVAIAALGQLAAQTSPQVGHQGKACLTLSRIKPLPALSDFEVRRVAAVKPKPPILSTARDKEYRTTIRRSVLGGANFAGHYVIAHWGCGTGCSEFVVADVKTGRVYDTNFQTVDYHYPPQDEDPGWWCYSDALTYSANSRLLVIEGCLSGRLCGRNYYVMEPSGLRHLSYDPDLLKDGTLAPF
jgi:hypothetical protein